MTNNNIKRIIFLGDLLRNQNDARYFADRSLGWEYHIFKEQIRIATGIESEVAFASENKIFDRDLFYKLCGYEKISQDNWLKILSGGYTEDALNYFAQCFKDCFVITQVGGAMKVLMDELNIPYIDIYVSAIKFLDDIRFAFRTNVDPIRQAMQKHRLPQENIFFTAGKVKAFYFAQKYSRPELDIEKDSLLLCGQTDVDLSLVKNGKIVTFLDFKDEIKELFSQYKHVCYKSHPYASSNNPNEEFIRSFKNLRVINYNFYELMCSDNIIAVAALSSGTLNEAPYFGKKIHTISHQFINYFNGEGSIDRDDFILINDDYYSPTFWMDILSPVIQTKEVAYFNFNDRKNVLRETLTTWWGYEIGQSMYHSLAIKTIALYEQVKYLQIELEENKNEIRKLKMPFGSLRRLIACFIPSRKIRRKLRDDK